MTQPNSPPLDLSALTARAEQATVQAQLVAALNGLRDYVRCAQCSDDRRAVCVGAYEDPENPALPACAVCCGHGNEDGWCMRLAEVVDGAVAAVNAIPVLIAEVTALRAEVERMWERIQKLPSPVGHAIVGVDGGALPGQACRWCGAEWSALATPPIAEKHANGCLWADAHEGLRLVTQERDMLAKRLNDALKEAHHDETTSGSETDRGEHPTFGSAGRSVQGPGRSDSVKHEESNEGLRRLREELQQAERNVAYYKRFVSGEAVEAARETINGQLKRLGYAPRQLQLAFRDGKWDKALAELAVCDALVNEGSIVAHPGDGVGCVAQMIEAQVKRAESAEAETRAIRAERHALLSVQSAANENAWTALEGAASLITQLRNNVDALKEKIRALPSPVRMWNVGRNLTSCSWCHADCADGHPANDCLWSLVHPTSDGGS